MRRYILGAWLSLLITHAAFGQGSIGLNTFRLHDQLDGSTSVTLPKRLRLRATYYQPLNIIDGITPTCPGGKRALVSPNGIALTGDDAMNAMPIFRGVIHQSRAGEVYLQAAGVAQQVSPAGSANPTLQVYAHAMQYVLQYRDGIGISFMTQRFSSLPWGSVDTEQFFCYRGVNQVMGVQWTDIPGGRNEFRIGCRWEYVDGALGPRTKINVYWDSREIQTCPPNSVPGDSTFIGSGGVEKLYITYVLEEDPGVAMSEIDSEGIIEAINEVTNAVQAFHNAFENPEEGDGDIEDEMPETVLENVWRDRVGAPLGDNDLEAMNETHTPPSGAPEWSWTIPVGTYSQMIGGPDVGSFDVSADFTPLTPYRLAIHAFFYALVGVWAAIYLFEELRKY